MHIATRLGWMLFASLVLLGAYIMLNACDLAIRPLFLLRFCAVEDGGGNELAREKQRHSDLQQRLQEAQLKLASLPACEPPPAARAPEHRAEDRPAPPPPPPEVLKVPKTLADLKGCWQSERGDLPLVSDDERRVPLGNVQICFCFGSNGQGKKLLTYTDGERCSGRITASLSANSVRMEQPELNCGMRKGMVRGYVRSRTVCTGSGDAAAVCETESLGRMGGRSTENFRRVSADHCGWSE